MQTLDEFNHKQREHYQEVEAAMQPHPNSIACPTCGKELWDTDPRAILMSNPPQKDVHCPGCKFTGHRLA